MKLKKGFWARILPVLIIAIFIMLMSICIYQNMMETEKETCWERLRIATESTAEKIRVRLTDNLNFLESLSDSFVMTNHLDNYEAVGRYMNSVMEKTIFERIDVVLPNGDIIKQNGELIHVDGTLTYNEIVQKGTHISPRTTDVFNGKEVLYCFTPIEKGGKVQAMLCGTIDCRSLSELFEVFTYKEEAQLFLVDCADGNSLMDNWHDELGNIYDMGLRESADGEELIDMVPPIINRETGRMAFVSKTNGENSYQYYAPVEDFNWEIIVVVQEGVVFANWNTLKTLLWKIGIIETLLLLIYLTWNVWISVSLIKSEERANKLELTKATNEAKARFISSMSHDIRTPLNGIVGMLHIIKKHREDEKMVDECLEKIGISTQYLSTLANDMLDINEIESDKLILEMVPVDLRKIADALKIMLEPKAREVQIDLKIDDTKLKHPYVFGSPVHIERILVNLISNAIKYRKDVDGKVEVSIEELDNHQGMGNYCFIVKDNGIGMSEEFQQNMYHAFAQEKVGARSSYQGYGLGLTIVYRLVEKMSGKIELESKKGEGSTFKVILPLKIDTQEKYPEQENEKVVDLQGKNILLVEDNEFNREIVEVILADLGANITTAIDGKFAVEVFEKSRENFFDLVLMDVIMPEIDGCQATRIIRAMDRKDAKTVPIFAMTAHTFSEEINNCKEAGMNEHIAKPIDVEKFMLKVAKYCKR